MNAVLPKYNVTLAFNQEYLKKTEQSGRGIDTFESPVFISINAFKFGIISLTQNAPESNKMKIRE